ncbi:nitrogenase molybdenum-cofactor synthesis protein NifE [Natranaerovirga pectinivora]|uniref:Nitrogenase iron-molybdenum cofactor biosynthesis protein NifE n=1 Tax=Natranaerovirga pectinivora TaxID=682400 RepID=A0A4R3MMQ4_9FIRM|nr:nitrogenase iron-molybdenum cofactor biosynthesis protein NifE [Natranaerovirga pectinivora]TCT15304.1 nitrogenase molybdenum-cofactor synthesis protein NifE [Natranaerovirga pectinivora]
MSKNPIILEERKSFVLSNQKKQESIIDCEKDSVSGAVSQRACVYCGARVVLNPVTDAIHLIHGPIGCASYTWDIRGSLSSDNENYRNSYSTDLREEDIIFGGEKRLEAAIDEIMESKSPKVIFVYATCVVGVIGDDLKAISKKKSQEYNIKVIPVQSSGFAGNKKDGYKAACHALLELMGPKEEKEKDYFEINYLGDFNLAGEAWIIRNYLSEIGVKVNVTVTGDATCEAIEKAGNAHLNMVQCAGSMTYLAKQMQLKYNIPFEQVSFFGVTDTAKSLEKIALLSGDKKIIERAQNFVREQVETANIELKKYLERLKGKKVAIYVGGGFKAISLIKQFEDMGIRSVVVGTQTGKEEEYKKIKELTEEGTIILDDTNPSELEYFLRKTKADILVGGVKERPLAHKLGVAFIDHNHERKHPLCGFVGAVNFAKEVDLTVNSPVWSFIEKKGGEAYVYEEEFYTLERQSL